MTPSLSEKLKLFQGELPLAKAKTLPALWYSDPEIYEAERAAIFGETWQLVGRREQVSEPGHYFTAEVAGESIVVVRDKDSSLKAFSNVCRHRGARVACEAQGRASAFRCRYHGWTYDLSGELIGTPEFDGVLEFERSQNGLPEFQVTGWGPFVFVKSGKRIDTLCEFLTPFTEQVSAPSLEKLKFVERREYILQCNWKVFVDNYLDGGYHVNTIHPSLAGVLNYKEYRTQISGNTSVQSSPLRAQSDPTIAQVRSGDYAYYWWLFPNTMINIYDGVMDSNVVFPMGPDRCRVVFDFFFDSSKSKIFIEQSLAVADKIQQEDLMICEDVQKGLKSRTYDTGRFSVRREGAGYHFHQLLARALSR